MNAEYKIEYCNGVYNVNESWFLMLQRGDHWQVDLMILSEDGMMLFAKDSLQGLDLDARLIYDKEMIQTICEAVSWQHVHKMEVFDGSVWLWVVGHRSARSY